MIKDIDFSTDTTGTLIKVGDRIRNTSGEEGVVFDFDGILCVNEFEGQKNFLSIQMFSFWAKSTII